MASGFVCACSMCVRVSNYVDIVIYICTLLFSVHCFPLCHRPPPRFTLCIGLFILQAVEQYSFTIFFLIYANKWETSQKKTRRQR